MFTKKKISPIVLFIESSPTIGVEGLIKNPKKSI
jgi:hypothetical protein